ncbi:ABC-2 type transport system permease protein [Saccharopolyspora kobensis]|uniref:ABC-2 type transport system permease protein n=1 Tax=Saccharopolyspora kobensis TaxID=146035 RepID=A0A1H6D4U2_9PSEU|nr:ABC transporter permease [Saccharopolyspora kobensis]SEG79988.1 ABC-2 type transport system permease protein [Saccharopolyspora kobensis]SFD10122.1 ABC-2 type transport system permease protein [Saccharopolyspora kobensis]
MTSAVLALGRTEWKLLSRNKAVLLSATLLPLLLGYMLAANVPADAGPAAWSMILGMQVLAVQGFTVYFTTTATLASRREDRYLKRLRSGEVSDAVILGGLLLPVVLLGLVQTAVVVAIATAIGAPVPANPLPLVLAALLGSAMSLVAGAATSGFTASSEQAQITTMPWFLVLIGGSVWVSMSGEITPLSYLVPSGGVMDLTRLAMTGENVVGALPAIGALLAWTAVLAVLSRIWFRWEPRA